MSCDTAVSVNITLRLPFLFTCTCIFIAVLKSFAPYFTPHIDGDAIDLTDQICMSSIALRALCDKFIICIYVDRNENM